MLKVLIVYAVKDEHFTFELPGYNFSYVRTGIGKVKAALRLTDAIFAERPDVVLNIGTAGTLTHQVGDMFVCHRFIDRDFSKIQLPGLDYEISFGQLPEQVKLFPDNCRKGTCNTGDSFLTEVADIQGDVFDMEGYAEALVCREKGIPFVSVKYVTDVIGQNSVKHWEDKLADARTGLKLFLETALTGR